ncbi:hypothetical protein 3 [Hubei odonate virus 10]|uniref:Uncharacterized protein n=1 Tax=Hubei odonate virus 10 TaxID=1922991 RepID=A0A1L3KMT8_9MONO|nr:hypothetical protein 3 [Hubei odonate virus 10]APG78698.1 hypothetical protein 3 [Hubei odonate virus 10]
MKQYHYSYQYLYFCIFVFISLIKRQVKQSSLNCTAFYLNFYPLSFLRMTTSSLTSLDSARTYISLYQLRFRLMNSETLQSVNVIIPVCRGPPVSKIADEVNTLMRRCVGMSRYIVGSPCKLYLMPDEDIVNDLKNRFNMEFLMPINQSGFFVNVSKISGISNSMLIEIGELIPEIASVIMTMELADHLIEYNWE